MFSPRLDWLRQCCSSAGCDREHSSELQVQLSTGNTHSAPHRILFAAPDSLDTTFEPRSFSNAPLHGSKGSRAMPMTPRQVELRNTLELPLLHAYPVPPHCAPEEPEEDKRQKLLEMYREFALDLHTGMYLTQLTSSRDNSDIHCQLMEDMLTLKMDQSNGRIIEFPLTGVSKVYRIVKNDDKWYSAGSTVPGMASNTEHIVVVEFMRRKLAFVFKEMQVSQRFLLCMELLIRRAQQKQAKKELRSLAPALTTRH